MISKIRLVRAQALPAYDRFLEDRSGYCYPLAPCIVPAYVQYFLPP
jgi:hypothetical protein